MTHRRRRVALVGRAGGGAATLGGGGPEEFLREIITTVGGVPGVEISTISYTWCEVNLDAANPDNKAKLWRFGGMKNSKTCSRSRSLTCGHESTLSEVNEIVRELDKTLATDIKNGFVDGLILVSSDPTGVNSASISAAAKAGIPVVGTGGTSIGKAMNMGVNIASGFGGSVATTSTSKAVSYACGLALAWNLKFSPPPPARKPINLHSLLDGCLPAFLAACLLIKVIELCEPFCEFFLSNESTPGSCLEPWPDLAISSLSLCVQVVACHQVSVRFGEIELISALIAGSFVSGGPSMPGKIISALLTGVMIPDISGRLLNLLTIYQWPATAATLTTAGGSGLLAGILSRVVTALVSPVVSGYHTVFQICLDRFPIIFGFIVGSLSVEGSRHGYYHMIMLPLILLEMEQGEMSFLGLIDMLSLVLVSAGICCANFLLPKDRLRSARVSALRGMLINLNWGDYIEAAYPYMEKSRVVMLGGYLGGGLGGAAAALYQAKGTAYVPFWILLILGENRWGCLVSMAISFTVPFFTTVTNNLINS
ncbi:hypothetical protein AAMO2058_000387600 [Amorphochlora amoebiformis]